jgi:hypothetical protein
MGEVVDVLDGRLAVVGVYYLAPDFYVAQGEGRVNGEDGDSRSLLHVAGFLTAEGGVDPDLVVVTAAPDGRYLGLAVGHDGCQGDNDWAVEQIEMGLG